MLEDERRSRFGAYGGSPVAIQWPGTQVSLRDKARGLAGLAGGTGARGTGTRGARGATGTVTRGILLLGVLQY